jgi:hypothetical protein
MRKRVFLLFTTGLFVLCLAVLFAALFTPLRERLSWRLASWQVKIVRLLNPPEQIVFIPGSTSQPGLVQTVAQATLDVLLPTPSPSPDLPSTASTSLQTLVPAVDPLPSPTPSPSPTALPEKALLTGIVHEYQQFNNCGPANLAMALSFWGWQGDQRDTRAYLRPRREVDDKNVNPAEMVAFVEQFTGLDALARVGGDLDLLRRLLAAGFPVLIEAGHHPPKDWWMGHYLVVSGYDDQQRLFTVQDSLANPDLPLSYDELEARWWRDFNYVYLVIYPPERQAELAQILGARLDEAQSYRLAEQKALEEISTLQGRDLFFAWFNLGSSRVGLGDYTGAAQAFDQAFELYQGLSEDQRPYRLLWYQDTPYRAYYNSGRYQDVVDLANITFSWVGQPVLEESYYWRGMANLALGMQPRAVADFTKAASLNPNFAPPRQELERLGEPIP